MEYKVVGWTHYDDNSVKSGPIDSDVVEAVIADIREHGYLFTGYHHQESYNCAPVLNDGMRRLFSRRQFGAIMAKAHGDEDEMAYAWYMDDYGIRPEALVFPGSDRSYFSPGRSASEEDMPSAEHIEYLRRLIDSGAFDQANEETDSEEEGKGQ